MKKVIFACALSTLSFFTYAGGNTPSAQPNMSQYPGPPAGMMCARIVYPMPGMTHEQWVKSYCRPASAQR